MLSMLTLKGNLPVWPDLETRPPEGGVKVMWDYRVPSVPQHRGLERRREARVPALSFKTEASHSGTVCKCGGVGLVQMFVVGQKTAYRFSPPTMRVPGKELNLVNPLSHQSHLSRALVFLWENVFLPASRWCF